MTATPSTMLPLGTTMPVFRCRRSRAKSCRPNPMPHVRSSSRSSVTTVRSSATSVGSSRALRQSFKSAGSRVVAINSNDSTAFPDDGPEGMKQEAHDAGYTFPYLFDETQDVAKAFRAACTPDLFLFDARGALVYRGQFDDSRPRNAVPVTGVDIRAAAAAVLLGQAVPTRAEAEHRLQHQVEARQRARLLVMPHAR